MHDIRGEGKKVLKTDELMLYINGKENEVLKNCCLVLAKKKQKLSWSCDKKR